jgi:ABC-type transport system involved in cytochrome bd biosynthesis fused ATPase/permease subunit
MPEIDPPQKISHKNHSIKLENASFAWNNDETSEEIIKNVSLNLASGKMVAMVGSISSGKSKHFLHFILFYFILFYK